MRTRWFVSAGLVLFPVFDICQTAPAPALLVQPPALAAPAVKSQPAAQAAAAAQAAPAAQPAPAPEPRLQLFTIPDGHASVFMPGVPVYDSQNVTLTGGGSTLLNVWGVSLEGDNIAYQLMMNDYPANYANGAPESILIQTRDAAVKGKTLLTDAAISLGNIPGRAFTVKDDSGNFFDVRQYFVNKRLYQLILVTTPGHAATFRDEFMNSFQIK